ncbi:ribonuclease H1-like [Belonocnema kinseyi]|uniref:ribonuclease H1-like n=1 Tax=Belonocnema kinseyi TaxID=2817044 RepID=UPI00143D18CD|nr:ribonuclease H1-like [Belonocnema kinseyi]
MIEEWQKEYPCVMRKVEDLNTEKRKRHSVLPELKPTIRPTLENKFKKNTVLNVNQNPCFSIPAEPIADVYVDAAYSYSGEEEHKAGIGVCFEPNHPLNVSQPARGRQINNFAEIQAATIACIKAHAAGINRLRINTDSKYLIDSATQWIPQWEENDWK